MKISMAPLALWPPVRTLACLAAVVACVAGCSVLDDLANAPAYNPYTLYLTDSKPLNVRTELVERYACASRQPLMCTRSSRLSATTDCHC